jgi:hypothetical protein
LLFRPVPFSDFAAYWSGATDVSMYTKGGILTLVYRPFAFYDVQPYLAALFVNTIAWMVLSFSLWIAPHAYPSESTNLHLFTLGLLAACGCWWIGFVPIVNSDLPSAAALAFGVSKITSIQENKTNKNLKILLAMTVAFACAFSVRSQHAAGFLVVACFALLLAIFRKLPWRQAGYLFIAVFSAVTIGQAVNSALIHQSTSPGAHAPHGRISLYVGLLFAEPDLHCGTYSKEIAARAIREKDRSLVKVAYDEIAKGGLARIASVVACKVGKILIFYNSVSSSWLASSSEMTGGKEPTMSIRMYTYRVLKILDHLAGISLKVLLIAMLYISSRKFPARNGFFVSLSILISYLLMHSMLEVQSRYVIGPLISAAVVLHAYMVRESILLSRS